MYIRVDLLHKDDVETAEEIARDILRKIYGIGAVSIQEAPATEKIGAANAWKEYWNLAREPG